MTRVWLALALLAASWLPGLGYYHSAHWPAWIALVLLGSALMVGRARVSLDRRAAALAAALLLPALFLAPWPLRLAALAAVLGLALQLAPPSRPWVKPVGDSLVWTGLVLFGQALALAGYASLTARSHELPPPLPGLLGGLAALLQIPTAVEGGRIALWSMRQVHNLGATWELLLGPCTLGFLAGGLLFLALRVQWTAPREGRRAWWWRAAGALALCVLVWLPVRVALLLGLYMNGVLRTDYEAALNQMPLFWSTAVHLLLLAGPVALVARFVRLPAESAPEGEPSSLGPRWWRAAAWVAAGAFLLSAAQWWDPVGSRKNGRVVVDEHHSVWERTDRPYDTEWYGSESGYNYACIYDYCSRFYEMSRLTRTLDDAALRDVSVLIVKVPTVRYAPAEIEAICRFVRRGGGLLLIGEHTDFMGTGRNLNEIARRFGFAYRYDCVFGVDTVFEEAWQPPPVRHPITQYMPSFSFEVSCSIAPGWSAGRAVMVGHGLKNLPADYHASNYYPPAEDRPDMRYGPFCQMWATRCGRGRVVAFTDSTVFSNFSTFEPGKAELMLGTLEWLSRRNRLGDPRWWLMLLGAAGLVGGLLGARLRGAPGLVLLAAASLGWAVAIPAVRAAHRVAMPLPRMVRPMALVVMDRTVSEAPLSQSGFIAGRAGEFGLFERWILRLGYFTARRSGAQAFTGDALAIIYPSQPPPEGYLDQLARYVQAGGRVLVVDAPENKRSSADSLLAPFGLTIKREDQPGGRLSVPAGWPPVPVENAWEVAGGKPFVFLGGRPVAATVQFGRGAVTALGFGSRFSDANMGASGDVIPDAAQRGVFDLEFLLLRRLAARSGGRGAGR